MKQSIAQGAIPVAMSYLGDLALEGASAYLLIERPKRVDRRLYVRGMKGAAALVAIASYRV
ncbi:hypothetical protein GCM10011611_50240 [Aliidongia dinghuensis]|uniref:Uncharacterized protein n=1 Tax=Aliidongia dinghuensis TaxID=1867774 RepID=A0A8J3E638_9PROT|nr:hypothetical protein GCM10011611_50240 [Aliidongia dinghuensis]